jgi:hypothetical protein
MGMLFYAGGDNGDAWEFIVDNPGDGELNVSVFAHAFDLDENWRITLHGPKLGAWLDRVTARALGTDTTPPDTVLPRFATEARAREILPSLQKAVALALAGTDRFERTWPDRDEAPAAPLCVRCSLGSDFSNTSGMVSPWCEQYGHNPFGTSYTWDQAQEAHQLDQDRYDRRRARELDQARTAETAAAVAAGAIDLTAARRSRRDGQS